VPGVAWPAGNHALGRCRSATFEGTDDEKRRFFFHIYRELENRIKIFVNLKIEALDGFSLQQHVNEIGSTKLAEETEH
jgi:arsenate reductase